MKSFILAGSCTMQRSLVRARQQSILAASQMRYYQVATRRQSMAPSQKAFYQDATRNFGSKFSLTVPHPLFSSWESLLT